MLNLNENIYGQTKVFVFDDFFLYVSDTSEEDVSYYILDKNLNEIDGGIIEIGEEHELILGELINYLSEFHLNENGIEIVSEDICDLIFDCC